MRDCLSATSPGGNAAYIYDLTFNPETSDQKITHGILEIFEAGACIYVPSKLAKKQKLLTKRK
jgi:hypothetical protein